MINRLINMEVPTIKEVSEPIAVNYSVKDYANSFINGMSDVQKNRFRKMLQNGIRCGVSVANNYGVNYDEFINEVKNQLGV